MTCIIILNGGAFDGHKIPVARRETVFYIPLVKHSGPSAPSAPFLPEPMTLHDGSKVAFWVTHPLAAKMAPVKPSAVYVREPRTNSYHYEGKCT